MTPSRALWFACFIFFQTALHANSRDETSEALLSLGSLFQPPVVTAEADVYTIFDRDLNEHSFRLVSSGVFEPINAGVGKLQALSESDYLWTDDNGETHEISHPRATSECPAHQPEFEDQDQDQDQNNNPEEEQSEQCNIDSNTAHEFQATPIAVTTLDARPASCNSYFVQYYGTQRGFAIEAGFDHYAPYSQWTPTIRTFPVVDFIADDALYVIQSRDLASPSLNSPSNPDALLDQLIDDGQKVKERFFDVLDVNGRVYAHELGQSTTIVSAQLKPVILQLVIRDGMASESHWQQISKAKQWLQEHYNITLEVVVIP